MRRGEEKSEEDSIREQERKRKISTEENGTERREERKISSSLKNAVPTKLYHRARKR